MDTVEAIATLVALWPNSFKPLDHWRPMLVEELERDEWTLELRRSAIDQLKTTHNGKRITIETLRDARRAVPSTRVGKSNLVERERVTVGWLAMQGLTDAFRIADIGDKIMIERLVWCVVNRPGWETLLAHYAGSPQYWQGWERIENLVHAASKVEVNGRKACYPVRDELWQAPLGELHFPPLPVKFSEAERIAGLKRISDIAEKHGGLKMGNFTALTEDPEYREYLADYAQREERARRAQHGDFSA